VSTFTPVTSTNESWERYKQNVSFMATGTSTMSKRPQYEPEEPCYIDHGKGCRVWDTEGREFIDFRNALGPVLLGYCYPAVDEAISQQLKKGIIFGHPTTLEAEVGELLVDIIPCAEKVRYIKTGGEAVAAAIKLARAATGKEMIVQCGYNGWLNSLAVGANTLPYVKQDIPRGVPQALSKLHLALNWGDLVQTEALFSEYGDQIAGVVVAMNYSQPQKAPVFLRGLRSLCDKHSALLIIDEIVTGFRIAIGGLHDYCNVAVDLAVYSKGLANGMPLSAVVGKREFMDYLETAAVSSTFSGETLSLAAAKATLLTYKNNDVISTLNRIGDLFVSGINRLFVDADYPLRAVGLPSCSILAHTSDLSQYTECEEIHAFLRAAYQHGVSLYVCNYPNYSCTEQDISEALGRLESAIHEIARI
jgi:glutamate-1-semialdehyde 2,1-aminomutase